MSMINAVGVTNVNIAALDTATKSQASEVSSMQEVKLALSFDDSPNLENPKSNLNSLNSTYAALPSAAAAIMALIQENLSELIRQNRDASYQAQMDAADLVDKEASNLRQKAVLTLASGIISGVVEIGAGAFSVISSSKVNTDNNAANLASMQQQANKTVAINQIISTSGKMVSNSVDFFANLTDAKIKELEADEQRFKATIEQIKSVNDSLIQTVQKALESMSTIALGNIEMQKRILG